MEKTRHLDSMKPRKDGGCHSMVIASTSLRVQEIVLAKESEVSGFDGRLPVGFSLKGTTELKQHQQKPRHHEFLV